MINLNKKVRELVDKYTNAETELLSALFELKNGDGLCDCKGDVETIETIATVDGDFNMNEIVVKRCLECGGEIENGV